jgi:hypothetical protein
VGLLLCVWRRGGFHLLLIHCGDGVFV